MYTISLNNLEFYSFHGYYQEENLIGNHFLVDIIVLLNDEVMKMEELESTLNYVTLYQIAKEEMAIPRKLLETVVKSIHQRIEKLSKNIHRIEVSLTKKHVPVEGMIGQAKVSYSN